jgi:hypothetical protein
MIGLREATERDHHRFIVADARAGRHMDLHGAPGAEQERIHGDREVRQGVENARDLEAAMEDRALAGQRAVLLPLAQRPQHEPFAHRQGAGTNGFPAARRRFALQGAKPLTLNGLHGLTKS